MYVVSDIRMTPGGWPGLAVRASALCDVEAAGGCCQPLWKSSEKRAEPAMDRFVILAVDYEPDATGAQRSLGWVAPELVHTGLTMIKDMLGVRKWAGVIDHKTYERFVESWGGDAHLTNYRHTWDGMEWEPGGSSPVVCVTLTGLLRLPGVEPVKRNLPFVYVG